jgi:hypothetical protein
VVPIAASWFIPSVSRFAPVAFAALVHGLVHGLVHVLVHVLVNEGQVSWQKRCIFGGTAVFARMTVVEATSQRITITVNHTQAELFY